MSSPSALFVADVLARSAGRSKEQQQRSRDQLSPLRPHSASSPGDRRSRRSSTSGDDYLRPSPTPSLGDRRSICRSPCSPSQTPSPQNFAPDYRPTVKFTVEGDPAGGGGAEEEEGQGGGGRRSASPGSGGRRGREQEAGTATRAKQIFMAQQPSPLPLPPTPPPYHVPPPGNTPPTSAPPDGRSLEAEGGEDDDEDDEEDYSASVSAIIQQRRRASTRRSRRHRGARRTSSPFSPLSPDGASLTARHDRRRSSVFTTSSADTGYSVAVADEARGPLDGVDPVAEGVAETASPTAIAAATQQQIFENLRLHKEVRESVRLQPWPMRRKVRLVQKAKAYVRRHEGELQERLAHGKSTRDLLARANLLIVKHWQHLRRELVNVAAFLIPWEQRIKEIESHFGSVVASYFTFLRWLFWVNLVIATLLIAFVITPEFLVGREDGASDNRYDMLPEEKATATNLLTLWDFEGALKYSPMFYGFYSNREKTKGGYRIPFAYFMTGLAVYVYSFVATLRKMAENSRMSKLSEKDDECVFSWKLFTGWDYMIGNAETAHNRVASIILGFKEVLLEEREKQKDTRNWKVIALRVLVNFMVLLLLASSAYAVVLVVRRSTKATYKDSWWRQNEITVVLSLISVAYPILFELIGFLESYHPRKQLRLQLARIMVLNLLNLYTLIFALFGKISNMTKDLQDLKPNVNSTATFTERENIYPGIGSNMTSVPTNLSSNVLIEQGETASDVLTNSLLEVSSLENTSLSMAMSPQCFKDLVACIIETTTVQHSMNVTSEKEIISLLVNVTTTLVPIFLKIVFHHDMVTKTTFSESPTPSLPVLSTTTNYSFDESISTESWTNELNRIADSISSTSLPKSSAEYELNDTMTHWPTEKSHTTFFSTTYQEFTTDVSDELPSSSFDPLLSNLTDSMTNVTELPMTDSTISQGTDFTNMTIGTYNDTIDEQEDIDNTSMPMYDDDLIGLSPTSSDVSESISMTDLPTNTEDVTSTASETEMATDKIMFKSETTFISVINNPSTTEDETTLLDSSITINSTIENNTFTPEESTENDFFTNWTSMTIDNKTWFSDEVNSTVGLYPTEATAKPFDTGQHVGSPSDDSPLDDFYIEINKFTEAITADYNLQQNSSLIDFSALFNTTTEGAFGNNVWAVTPSDLDIPIPLLKLDPKNALDTTSSSTTPADLGSNSEELESRMNDELDVDDLNKSGHEADSVTQSESDLRKLQSHARTLLVGHVLTILLTAAILVSKGEDSKMMTEKLLKKDESRILEIISVWRDAIHIGNFTKSVGFSKGEECFTALCQGKSLNKTASIVQDADLKAPNCSTLLCSSASPLNTSDQALEKAITATTTDCPVITKRNFSCQLVNNSRLELKKKLKRLCWETMFGQELVKLTVMDLVLTIASTFLVDFVRALFVRIMNHCWCWDLEKQFPQYGDFKIAENILHLVYNQGMVWMGMFFSPGLPALNLAKLAIVLYVRSWIVLTCNVPHDVVFRASRSNNFYLALLLTMLFLCALPVGYALVWVEPSWHCGPFAGRDRIASLFTSSMRAALPDQLRPVLDYVASPALVIPLLVLLVLVVAYLVSLAAALREANDDLRTQLRRERTEERRKMFRMANGRGGGRRGRRSRTGRASDDASALGVPLEDFPEGGEGEVGAEGGSGGQGSEGKAVPVVTGWRGLIGRLTNIRSSPGKFAKKEPAVEQPLAIVDSSSLKETQDNEANARCGGEDRDDQVAADEGGPSQPSGRLPTLAGVIAAAVKRPKADEEEMMEEATGGKSSPPAGDSPSSSACWSGDIPLIRIVSTADEVNRRTPQQAQPQQPLPAATPPTPPAAYVNAAMDVEEDAVARRPAGK